MCEKSMFDHLANSLVLTGEKILPFSEDFVTNDGNSPAQEKDERRYKLNAKFCFSFNQPKKSGMYSGMSFEICPMTNLCHYCALCIIHYCGVFKRYKDKTQYYMMLCNY